MGSRRVERYHQLLLFQFIYSSMVERPAVNREALIRCVEVRALVDEPFTSCSSIVEHPADNRDAGPTGDGGSECRCTDSSRDDLIL